MHAPRLRLAASALVTAAALTGCGLDSSWRPLTDAPASSISSGTTLTPAQAAEAVIGLDDLGDGFMVDPDDGDGGSSSLGCLDDIGTMMDSSPGTSGRDGTTVQHDAQYKATGDLGLPFVLSSVTGMGSAADIKAGFALIQDALQHCHQVDTTDDDGARTQLTVTTDREAGKGATAQLNITATGHLSLVGPGGQQLSMPFYLSLSLAQVDDNLAMVGYGSMVEPGEGDADAAALDAYAVARLRAVMSGTPAPAAPDLGLRRITDGDLLAGLTSAGSGHEV